MVTIGCSMIKRAFLSYIVFLCLAGCSSPEEAPSEAQIKEWQRLYPKLNSKMARMEELLNYIERFLGDADFSAELLESATEFSYLAVESQKSIPDYLSEEDQKPYLEALQKTSKLGDDLYVAMKKSDYEEVRTILQSLAQVRKESHANWAE